MGRSRNTDNYGDNSEEVLPIGSNGDLDDEEATLIESEEDLDDDPDDEESELLTPSGNHKLVIDNSLKSASVVVRGEDGSSSYIHAPEEGGRQDREAQEILATMFSQEGSVEKLPPLKMKYSPVSFWKRRTVQAIAALGLLGVIGGVYEIWKQLQPSPNETEETIKVTNPTATPTPTVVEEATEESHAPTLYDEVGNRLETKTEGTGLGQGTIARIHAASTNDLTESLYDGAKQWETLDGKWLDTPEAHANVVKKLTTWGGYQDVLTVSANAHSIDEMLEDIANSDLPHSGLVAWKVATQIASIKDARVVPSVEEVQSRLGAVDSATIDKTLDENIENPPPVPGPSFFADQAEQTGSLDSSLYDAPEPVGFLAKATHIELHTPTAVTIPAPRFEDRFDAIEPAHVKPLVQAKAEAPVVPLFMDPTEAAEPVTLLAKREAEIPDVTEFLEEDPVPKPVPTLLENAKSAFSGLTSRFRSWLS